MLTIGLVLVIVAMGLTIANAFGKTPLWFAVFVVCLIELLRVLPR